MWDDAFWYFYDNSPGHSSCGSQPVFYFNFFFFPYNILLTEAQAQASLSQMLLRFGTMCYWFLTGRGSCHRSLLNNLWGKTVCNDWWNCFWLTYPWWREERRGPWRRASLWLGWVLLVHSPSHDLYTSIKIENTNQMDPRRHPANPKNKRVQIKRAGKKVNEGYYKPEGQYGL